MKKPVQEFVHPKWTKDEVALIGNTFKGNENVLKVLRKVLFQNPLDENEQEVMKNTFNTDGMKSVLVRHFLPSLKEDWALTHEYDVWQDSDIPQRLAENGAQIVKAREKANFYMEQQIEILCGGVEGNIKFWELEKTEGKSDVEIYIDHLARRNIHARVQNGLRDLRALAEGTETTAELLKKQQQNSSR